MSAEVGQPRPLGLPESPEAETRQQGVSPVAESRSRVPWSMIAGFLAIMLAAGFLFLTGGKSSKPASATKPSPAFATAPGLPPAAPAPPPLPPAPVVPPGFPPPPVPGKEGQATATATREADAKAEARRRAPMLIYDVSGKGEQSAPGHASPFEDAQSQLAAQLLKTTAASLSNTGDAPREANSGTPSEGYADRTSAFAKKAAEASAPEAAARRISLDNRIAQGKMLAATLETAISSDLPGKLRAVVSSDVWSEDGSRRLVLRGSRLIGEYRAGLVRGQTRVFVIWTRLLQPDGTDLAIASPGTDDLGRAGLTGTVDRHFAERFGAAVLLSLIGSTTTASQGGSTVIIDTSRGFSQVAQESLQDSVNIPPTITVNQGAPVQVFVARDLIFDPMKSGTDAAR